MISYKKALNKLIRSKLSTKSEIILSTDSLNRVCSENVYSKFNYPAADNTALDGFAINSSESNKASKNNSLRCRIRHGANKLAPRFKVGPATYKRKLAPIGRT